MGDVLMNRQQRRAAKRQSGKDAKVFREVLTDPQQRAKNESLIRATFSDGQIYNNHEWAVRLERIREVKGIGPALLDRIFRALEEPLNTTEQKKARKQYESGEDHVTFGN